VPLPAALVQPFEDTVTVYAPPLVTVIDGVVAPLLHNKLPVALVESTLLPQLFTTVTIGVAGVLVGAAVPLPAALVQPFEDTVTVYAPALVTVIDGVVAPLLHNKLPVALVESTLLPQLFTTVTIGVAGALVGAATPVPVSLVQPFSVAVTV
jgi:ABC-type phosphate/phosphonate transport system permease subunit